MIERDPQYYTQAYEGEDPSKAPFYKRALVFDGSEGDLNASLIEGFNDFLKGTGLKKRCCLTDITSENMSVPKRIVVINASHDNLPASYETGRIFEDLCREKGNDAVVIVVNKREELMKAVNEGPEETLIMSQCVDKFVYNTGLVDELVEKGVVIVPGRVTAPGSVFSDKDSTYQLLSNKGEHWDIVAKYRKVSHEKREVEEVVDGIFSAIDELEEETGDRTFFVKPHEGGGGLGGFRITKLSGGYVIPDLSKVTGDASEIHPTFIDFDTDDVAKLRELLYIYRFFASHKNLSDNYLMVKLPVIDVDDNEGMSILKEYLSAGEDKRTHKLAGMVMDPDAARKKLTAAIKTFEEKFDRRYVPLVNEHLDFGLWGLRAHYRLSHAGPILEALYHRIFQLGFTEEGLGYVGSDNISNKQTGELEITRLGPINKIMLESIGGEKNLFDTLFKGAEALVTLAELVPEEERRRLPIRVQLDLAAVSSRIGEGNADTSRGMSIASRWPVYVNNAREWLEDSLAYYAWKRK